MELGGFLDWDELIKVFKEHFLRDTLVWLLGLFISSYPVRPLPPFLPHRPDFFRDEWNEILQEALQCIVSRLWYCDWPWRIDKWAFDTLYHSHCFSLQCVRREQGAGTMEALKTVGKSWVVFIMRCRAGVGVMLSSDHPAGNSTL